MASSTSSSLSTMLPLVSMTITMLTEACSPDLKKAIVCDAPSSYTVKSSLSRSVTYPLLSSNTVAVTS